MRLFLNPENTAYLRGLSDEFGESTNAVRLELNRFEEAGMLMSETQGNKKLYRANQDHPLYADVHNILLKHVGLDQIVDKVIHRLGKLTCIYLTGDYAKGKDSGIIDLVLIGSIDVSYLTKLVERAEAMSQRKVRFLNYSEAEWEQSEHLVEIAEPLLLLWKRSDGLD